MRAGADSMVKAHEARPPCSKTRARVGVTRVAGWRSTEKAQRNKMYGKVCTILPRFILGSTASQRETLNRKNQC